MEKLETPSSLSCHDISLTCPYTAVCNVAAHQADFLPFFRGSYLNCEPVDKHKENVDKGYLLVMKPKLVLLIHFADELSS